MKMDHQVNRCGYCNKMGSKLKRCGRCKNVQYCTKLCQSSDWTYHKNDCLSNVTKGSLGHVKENNLEAVQKGTREVDCDGEVMDGDEKQMNRDSHVELDKVETVILNKIRQEYSNESNGNGSTFNQTYEENERIKYKKEDQSTINSETGEYLLCDSKTKENDLKVPSESEEDEKKSKRHTCGFCSNRGCSQKCSRCMGIYYCSKECQRQDWKTHKTNCKKVVEERRKIDEHQRTTESLFHNNDPYSFSFGLPFSPTLPPEQAKINATPPKDSLRKAIKMTKKLYPSYKVVTNFVDVPCEPSFNFFPFIIPNGRNVLVAFMYKYHEHVMRHGVYLKDDCENESKVEFYLDCDNPSPFFSFSQVKPGGYICIVNAAKHLFRDGSVGFRIDKPEDVKILDIETVMK